MFVNFDTFFRFKLNKFYMVMVNISELIAKYIKNGQITLNMLK